MADESSSAERGRNIWAPWRIEYIRELEAPADRCFLCEYGGEPDKDVENLVLWRGRKSFAVLNRFPYTGGHLLIAPFEHRAELGELDDETILEMMVLVRDAQEVLVKVVRAQGFNIGINIGRCAGAGLPGHLHAHIVPRWNGDTNFMAVLGDVRVIPESLDALYEALRKAGDEGHLPKPRGPGGESSRGDSGNDKRASQQPC
ncbi:MAG TPA: HIT domain-containing protein [Phycisphaerae bacterium]|nr:HIT domain-containing protein [Phycisphaerae bacterium]